MLSDTLLLLGDSLFVLRYTDGLREDTSENLQYNSSTDQIRDMVVPQEEAAPNETFESLEALALVAAIHKLNFRIIVLI